MILDDYVRLIQEQLGASAALGDKRTRQVASALAVSAEPAVRLALMGALSAAAEEVTAALLDRWDAPVVSIRVDGTEVHVEVTQIASPAREALTVRPADDGDTSARISLRLSEALKSEIEAAAGRDGVSVNSWLVRAASAALSSGPAVASGTASTATEASYRRVNDTHRVTGWVNG